MKTYFENNEAHKGKQLQPHSDATAAFDVIANCTSLVRDDGKTMSLSWEQPEQDPVKLYNISKTVSLVHKLTP